LVISDICLQPERELIAGEAAQPLHRYWHIIHLSDAPVFSQRYYKTMSRPTTMTQYGENIVNQFELLLLALPAVAMFSYTIYMKKLHDEVQVQRARLDACTYGVLAGGFFFAAYFIKLAFA